MAHYILINGSTVNFRKSEKDNDDALTSPISIKAPADLVQKSGDKCDGLAFCMSGIVFDDSEDASIRAEFGGFIFLYLAKYIALNFALRE